jgi:site-specific recombinase XerD
MELPKLFENYLKKRKKVSGKTLRNYRADLSHFLTWAFSFLNNEGKTVNNCDDLLPYFNSQLIASYKGAQLEKGIPQSTTNRRLSTLRNFGKFLTEDKYIEKNPTEIINNVKATLSWEKQVEVYMKDFSSHLEKEGVSQLTAKNYISDIRQFLIWSQKA